MVITGATAGWPAHQRWTQEQLLQVYADHKFKVRARGWTKQQA